MRTNIGGAGNIGCEFSKVPIPYDYGQPPKYLTHSSVYHSYCTT